MRMIINFIKGVRAMYRKRVLEDGCKLQIEIPIEVLTRLLNDKNLVAADIRCLTQESRTHLRKSLLGCVR